ncbi:MAG: hypothetical protein ACLS36_05625 [Streptococcus sp.]
MQLSFQLLLLTVDQSGIDKLKNQPMWLIHTKADATVQPENSVLPLYEFDYLWSSNKWFSYFETATGTDLPGQSMMVIGLGFISSMTR